MTQRRIIEVGAPRRNMANAPFNLNDMLRDVAARVTPVSGGARGEGLVSVTGDVPHILTGDETGLRQVLIEFIEIGRSCGLAVAAVVDADGDTDPDRGSLTLRCRAQGCGEGLTCDEASTILTTFLSGGVAANAGSGRSASAQVRELIDRMDASVAVERAPGHGFVVSFAAEFGIGGTDGLAPDGAGGPFRRFRDPEMRMPEGLARLNGARILLAEDNPVNQNLTREILVQVGCAVEVAEDGRATVDAVRRHAKSFDAILMDVQMPIMDGYEATRQIRTEVGRSDLPIIAMTANVLCDERERCLAAGMNDYIAKPFHIPDLYATLIRWVAPFDRSREHPGDGGSPEDSDPATTGTDETSLPNKIPQIDVSMGLSRALGNRELYADLLAQFARTNRSLGVDVAAAIASGDLDRARFLVHGVSSSAGNLGAQTLHEAARELEHALANGNELNDLLAPFQDRLERVLAGIRDAGFGLNGRQVRLGEGQQPLDRNEALQAAETLSAMLEDHNMAARTHADRVLYVFGGRGRDDQLQSLIMHLEALEFAEAKQVLADICEDILK